MINVELAGPGDGSAKFGWLNALKKLVRNWNANRSPILKVLCKDISHAFKPGAVRGLRGQLPHVPGAGSENELTDAYGCVKSFS